MKKHGISHAAAVLVTTCSSVLLIEIVRRHVPYIYNAVNRFSSMVIESLQLHLEDTEPCPNSFSK